MLKLHTLHKIIRLSVTLLNEIIFYLMLPRKQANLATNFCVSYIVAFLGIFMKIGHLVLIYSCKVYTIM